MAEIVLNKTENSPLRCLVVDDELIAIKVIEDNIGKLDFLKIEGVCSSAMEAAELLKEKDIDLMFLDINMPDLSGLEFLESLELQHNNEGGKSNLYIRQNDSFKRISWEEILYVEGMQNYLKLHFKDKMFIIHQTMTSLEEMLPNDIFFKIHKSFLVNLSCIDSISGNRVFINNQELPISSLRKDEFMNAIVYQNLISK